MNKYRKQLRQRWKATAAWVDARKLSERVMLFAFLSALLSAGSGLIAPAVPRACRQPAGSSPARIAPTWTLCPFARRQAKERATARTTTEDHQRA